MTTFLGFFKNNMTAEEFVAPTEAGSRNDAEWQLLRQYPQGIYSLLTIYAHGEMKRVMGEIERWPGMASKPQPSVDQLLAKVSVSTRGLPPMPGQQRVEQDFDGGRIERMREAVKGTSAEVQELAARLLAADLHGKVAGGQNTYSHAPVADARASTPRAASIPAVAMPAAPMPSQSANRPSLISLLKTMHR